MNVFVIIISISISIIISIKSDVKRQSPSTYARLSYRVVECYTLVIEGYRSTFQKSTENEWLSNPIYLDLDAIETLQLCSIHGVLPYYRTRDRIITPRIVPIVIIQSQPFNP